MVWGTNSWRLMTVSNHSMEQLWGIGTVEPRKTFLTCIHMEMGSCNYDCRERQDRKTGFFNGMERDRSIFRAPDDSTFNVFNF